MARHRNCIFPIISVGLYKTWAAISPAEVTVFKSAIDTEELQQVCPFYQMVQQLLTLLPSHHPATQA